jgi:hypothetical protein
MAKKTRHWSLRLNAKRRPKNVPRGMVLAHNHILHDQNTMIGVNGFRAFYSYRKDLPHFVECPCGWRPDWGKHYAWDKHVKLYDTPRKRAKRYREYTAQQERMGGKLKRIANTRRSYALPGKGNGRPALPR